MNTNPWVVNAKGNTNDYEISVTRKDYKLGWDSYGWAGKDKEILFEKDYLSDPIPQWIFDELLKITEKRCRELNE